MRLLVVLQLVISGAGLAVGAALWLLGPRGRVPFEWAPALLATGLACGLLALVGAVLLRQRRALAVGTGLLGVLTVLATGAFGWLLVTGVGDPVRAWSAPPGETLTYERLRVLTFDVGPAEANGDRFADRRASLLGLIQQEEPDVVLLERASDDVEQGSLVASLADELGMHATYVREHGSRPLLGYEEGVAMLSRYPIREAERWLLRPHPSPLERRIALRAEVDHPLHGPFTVVALDRSRDRAEGAAAGGGELLERLSTRDGSSRPVLVAGSFSGPSPSEVRLGPDDVGWGDVGWVEVAEAETFGLWLRARDWRVLWGAARRAESAGSTEAWEPPARREASASTRPALRTPLLMAELAPANPPRRGTWPGEWQSVPPKTVGMDGARLERAVQAIGRLEGLEFLLVVRDGRLVAEEYFRGASPGDLHNVKSVSKSVLSAVLGIAVEQGHLSLDDPIADYLPQAAALEDPRKRAITVENLATMRTGLESTSFGNYGSWVSSRDWIRNALERPLVDEPGGRRRYSTGDTHLLSAVLTAATGTSTLEFARKNLFEPLGIERVVWERDPTGIYVGGNNLALTARDIARFGLLYLDRGRWGDRQLVPWQWVDRSTRANGPPRSDEWGRYGYLWWLRPPDERGAYTANGFGGQFLYLSPADDLLVVVGSTQTSKPRGWRRPLFDLIRDGILGSVETRLPSVSSPPPSSLTSGSR